MEYLNENREDNTNKQNLIKSNENDTYDNKTYIDYLTIDKEFQRQTNAVHKRRKYDLNNLRNIKEDVLKHDVLNTSPIHFNFEDGVSHIVENIKRDDRNEAKASHVKETTDTINYNIDKESNENRIKRETISMTTNPMFSNNNKDIILSRADFDANQRTKRDHNSMTTNSIDISEVRLTRQVTFSDDFKPDDDFMSVKAVRQEISIDGLRIEDSEKEPKIVDEGVPSVLADSGVTLR